VLNGDITLMVHLALIGLVLRVSAA
jgi:hypothetical protein